jgi:soluble lytic murein transglycosylase-like protein
MSNATVRSFKRNPDLQAVRLPKKKRKRSWERWNWKQKLLAWIGFILTIPITLPLALYAIKFLAYLIFTGLTILEAHALTALNDFKHSLLLDHAKKEGVVVLETTMAPIELQAFARERADIEHVNRSLVLSIFDNESRLNFDALSDAGAIGIGQIMSSNVHFCNLKSASRLVSAKDNIICAVKILKALLQQTGGDEIKTIGLYNYSQAAKKPFTEWPPKTQRYVRDVLASYKTYLHLENEKPHNKNLL